MFSIYRESLNSVQKKGKLNCNGKLYNNVSGIRSCKYCILILYNSEFYQTMLLKYPACLYYNFFFFREKKQTLYLDF